MRHPEVVLPLALALCAATIAVLRRRGKLTWSRGAAAVLVWMYVALVVDVVVVPDPGQRGSVSVPLTAWINARPLENTELSDGVHNVVLFLPLGLLGVAIGRSWRVTVAFGAAASLCIELSQLATDVWLGGEHAADINDLLANTFGAALGAGLGLALLRTAAGRRASQAVRGERPAD